MTRKLETVYTRIPRCDKKISKPTQEEAVIAAENPDSAQIKKVTIIWQ